MVKGAKEALIKHQQISLDPPPQMAHLDSQLGPSDQNMSHVCCEQLTGEAGCSGGSPGVNDSV